MLKNYFQNRPKLFIVEDIEDRFKNSHTEEEVEKRKNRIRNLPKNEHYISAKIDNKIVGVCRIVLHEDKNQLQAIYVLPEYQGKGIGYALWQEAKKSFDSKKETIVQVAIYNKNAIAFYEKLGFKDNGKRFSDEKFRLKSGNIISEMEMSMRITN